MKLQTRLLTAAAALLLTNLASAQVMIFTDIGTTAPTPGALDISQLSNTGTGADGQLNYYWDNGRQHTGSGAGNGFPGETFTTGANAAGYRITSLAIKTDGNGGDDPTQLENFTLAIYQLSGTGNTNAALLATYTAPGTLAAEDDWVLLSLDNTQGKPLTLAANTTYAYGFGISPSGSTESWERLSSATGTTFAGQICLVNVSGGTGAVTYSTNTAESVATFDLGLQLASSPATTPPPPPLWTANKFASVNTNGVLQFSLWGGNAGPLTELGATAAGAPALAQLAPMVAGANPNANTVYGLASLVFFTNTIEGPNNDDAGSLWGTSEAAPTISYADSFTGVFIPPVTTNYTFYICSDDMSQLWLSTDITAAHSVLIAEETAWSNIEQWTTSGGSSTLSQKDSSTFVAAGGAFPQYPAGIPLVAGWKYFIQQVHVNGNGGYNDQTAYTYFGAPAPVNASGASLDITNNVIGFVEQPPSFVTFTTVPASTTVYAGGEAAFSVAVSSDATPYSPTYQWQTNGVNVTNADGTVAGYNEFSYIVGTNDTGTKVTCAVTFPGATTNIYLSPSATITVTNSTLIVGGLKREFWLNEPALTTLTGGDVGAPAYVSVVTNGEGPINTGINNYVERYSGWFTPPATGSYSFFVTSDDYSDMFISTDSTPDSKYLIAQETDWATNYEWLTDAAGGNPAGGTGTAQKSSATFLPTGALTPPYASGIALTAGKQDDLEVDHDQGGGGDDCSFTYVLQSNIASITNGVPSAFGGANIAFEIPAQGTNLSFSQAPQNVTAFDGNAANFQATVSTSSTLQPVYKWLVNGTNMGGGIYTNLTSTFSISPLSLSDNGEQVQLVVTIPFSTLAITSSVVTLTVQQAVTYPGFLQVQFYPNQATSQAAVEAGTGGNPSYTTTMNSFEAPLNDGINDYTRVISGFFIPPETGLYVFNTCADDELDLFLSTDDNPANKRLIAQVPAWSNENQWQTSASGSALSQEESDTWSPDPTVATPPVPFAGGIPLTKGSNYYIAAYHYQGTTGDNAGVYFWTEDGVFPGPPADNTAPDFDPTNLAMLAVPATIAITTNPQPATVESGTSASFTAAGTTDSQISVNYNLSVFIVYQWYTNGVAVPGATQQEFTTELLPPSANGTEVYCSVSAIGAPTTNTASAKITVNTDTTVPKLTSAYYVLDSGGTGGEGTNFYVDVSFSYGMNVATLLNAANYTLSGGATITGVSLFTNGYAGTNALNEVILQIAAPLKGAFTLSVSGLQSFSGIPISPTGSSVTGSSDPLTSEDIALGNVTVPGTTIYNGPGSYTINSSGFDIWNSQDSFRFVYQPTNGNFDIAVQITAVDPADTWTKCGLMARETIDPLDGGSRMISVETTASTTQSPKPQDGSAAQNELSGGWRSATDTAAFNGTQDSPGQHYFFTTLDIPPDYPGTWVRLTRQFEGTTNDIFTGYGSTNNGATWTELESIQFQNTTNGVGDGTLTNAPMPSTVYIGICQTAHESAVTDLNVATGYYQNYGNTPTNQVTPPPSQPTLTAKLASPTTVSVSWTPGGGTLYSSPTLTTNGSSWTVVGTANPSVVNITGGAQFFEIRE